MDLSRCLCLYFWGGTLLCFNNWASLCHANFLVLLHFSWQFGFIVCHYSWPHLSDAKKVIMRCRRGSKNKGRQFQSLIDLLTPGEFKETEQVTGRGGICKSGYWFALRQQGESWEGGQAGELMQGVLQ